MTAPLSAQRVEKAQCPDCGGGGYKMTPGMSGAFPCPKCKPAPSPAEVEEAMDEVEGILVGWSFHSGFPSEDGLAALAVIRAALTKP